MSMDLDFWKYQKGVYLNHQQVYEACCNGEAVDGLVELPISAILSRVDGVFTNQPGWERFDEHNYKKKNAGAFSVFTTTQFVRFDCYRMIGDDMNLLIDVMLEFGCPLYDPQVSERFDEGE